jgi:excisionase family DNA binding protein
MEQPQQNTVKLLLTMEEAAQVMSLGQTYFYGLVSRENIHTVKLGRRRLVPLKSLETYIDEKLAQEGYHVESSWK